MIPYMVGKLAPKSSHLTRGLVKYVPGRGCFRAVSSHNGGKFVTSPPPPIGKRAKSRTPLNGEMAYFGRCVSTKVGPFVRSITDRVLANHIRIARKCFNSEAKPVLFAGKGKSFFLYDTCQTFNAHRVYNQPTVVVTRSSISKRY